MTNSLITSSCTDVRYHMQLPVIATELHMCAKTDQLPVIATELHMCAKTDQLPVIATENISTKTDQQPVIATELHMCAKTDQLPVIATELHMCAKTDQLPVLAAELHMCAKTDQLPVIAPEHMWMLVINQFSSIPRSGRRYVDYFLGPEYSKNLLNFFQFNSANFCIQNTTDIMSWMSFYLSDTGDSPTWQAWDIVRQRKSHLAGIGHSETARVSLVFMSAHRSVACFLS
ncbi:unnamed protein product [Candidula unifasciata]|uniref:Uncharacterized protein n=1 Tax=Candidula unifasciata TaxID=100452 RepID=A0A8S3YNA3_9EUPU|nr:unnamed protein product [Candidula unifasciata]